MEQCINLQDKRLLFTNESLRGYKIIRNFVEERSNTDGRFVGITFFGSRTYGLETPVSDYDMIAFYDATGFEINGSEDVNVQNRKIEAKKNYVLSLRRDVVTMMKQSRLPIDDNVEASIYLLDSSIDINNFRAEINRKFNDEPVSAMDLSDDIMSYGFPLAARFFFGFGDRLMNNRQEILQKFEQDEQGNQLFTDLMEYVKHYERYARLHKRPGLPLYEKYPSTIQEARKYFLLA